MYYHTLATGAQQEIATVAATILAKAHVIPLWQWESLGGDPFRLGFGHAISLFLWFLDSLATRGALPVASDARFLVRLESRPTEFEWSILPPELRWVGQAAERFGKHSFEIDMLRYAAKMDAEERAEFTTVALRLAEVEMTLDRWLSEWDRSTPEIKQVHNLIQMPYLAELAWSGRAAEQSQRTNAATPSCLNFDPICFPIRSGDSAI
ncbi:MAG: hypothetical protein U1D55_00435 [Phycisphaerae bacterium]